MNRARAVPLLPGGQLAVVRTLLDDIERAAPAPGTAGFHLARGEQLIEELARLGHQVLECAEAMTAEDRPSLAGSVRNGSGGSTTGPGRGRSHRTSLQIAGRRGS